MERPLVSEVDLTWEDVVGRMLESGQGWEGARFRAQVRVRYEREGLLVAQRRFPLPPPAWRNPWVASSSCRLFGHPGGASQTLEQWIEDPGYGGAVEWSCEEELSATRNGWNVVRHSGRPDEVEDPYNHLGPRHRGPGWLHDGDIRGAPHFREMLDPAMVMSSVEMESVEAKPEGWLIRAKPRPVAVVTTYYAAIVHPFGDAWSALISRDFGSIVSCQTELTGALLARHLLTVQLRDAAGPILGSSGFFTDSSR